MRWELGSTYSVYFCLRHAITHTNLVIYRRQIFSNSRQTMISIVDINHIMERILPTDTPISTNYEELSFAAGLANTKWFFFWQFTVWFPDKYSLSRSLANQKLILRLSEFVIYIVSFPLHSVSGLNLWKFRFLRAISLH